MATDTIKSFLVAIGYKHDEVALKKITDGIEKATKSVLVFGAALTATATTVAWAVTRVASNLDSLYFASMRTGTGAKHLEAFDLAAQRMGAHAGEGIAAAEKLAAYIRTRPAGTAGNILGALFPGMKFDEKDPVATLMSMGESMQKMDYFRAQLMAKAVGMDEGTVWWLRQQGLGPTFAGMERSLGPNFGKAVEDAHRFENSLALLDVRLKGFGATIIDVLEKKFGWNLDKISAWLDKNGARLANSLVNGIQKIVSWAERLWPILEKLAGYLVKLDASTHGWSTVVLALSVAMPGLVSGVTSLAGAFAMLATGAAATGIGGLVAAAGAGAALGAAIDKWYPAVPSWLADKASGFTEWVSGLNLRARFGTESARMQWAMEQFQKMGWSAQQAAGLVASAHYESSMNPTASNYDKEGHLHFGLFQWGADRLANFARIAKERGWDVNDPMAQLRFADWELRHGTEQLAGNALLASQNAARAGYIVSHAYERPGSDVQDALRSGLAVQLANSTNITISGSQDPVRTADLIQTRMAKLDAALIREFASNVQ